MLHGVVFDYQPKLAGWVVMREAGKTEPLALHPTAQLWDGRFIVSGAAGFRIAALGQSYLLHREALAARSIPKPAWPTLPAIFRLEECVAIPHIRWKESGVLPDLQIEFVASKLLEPKGECARA